MHGQVFWGNFRKQPKEVVDGFKVASAGQPLRFDVNGNHQTMSKLHVSMRDVTGAPGCSGVHPRRQCKEGVGDLKVAPVGATFEKISGAIAFIKPHVESGLGVAKIEQKSLKIGFRAPQGARGRVEDERGHARTRLEQAGNAQKLLRK